MLNITLRLHYYTNIINYELLRICLNIQQLVSYIYNNSYLKYYTMPRLRVLQDTSRIIFKFQNRLLKQKLYTDKVSINFI